MDRETYKDISENEETHWWFVARRAILRGVLDRFARGNARMKILEVGCGSGGNLPLLRTYGDLSAVEPDERSRQVAANRGLCDVVNGRLPDEMPSNQRYDLICVLDALEHVEDDMGSLHTLRGVLRDDGLILLTVPAYTFLWSHHDVANGHVRRYTLRQLTDIVSGLGYTIEYATYFNTFLFPVISAIRILSRLFNIRNGNDIRMPSPFVNKLLTHIFASETLLIPRTRLPFGVSLLLVARKGMNSASYQSMATVSGSFDVHAQDAPSGGAHSNDITQFDPDRAR